MFLSYLYGYPGMSGPVSFSWVYLSPLVTMHPPTVPLQRPGLTYSSRQGEKDQFPSGDPIRSRADIP